MKETQNEKGKNVSFFLKSSLSESNAQKHTKPAKSDAANREERIQ